MKALFGVLLFFVVILSDCDVFCNTLCAYSKKDNVKYKRVDLINEDESVVHQHSIAGHAIDANNTEHCPKDSDSCFALWYEDPVNKSIIILTQGCWDSSGNGNCDYSECISNIKPPKALNNTKFCCCSENLCNINVTDGYVSTPLDPALHYVDPIAYTSSTVVVIAVAAMTLFVVLALVAYYIFRLYFHPLKRSKESVHLIESATTQTPSFDFESLKIKEAIGRGRYGTVCKGMLQDHVVAVKIFSFQNKQYYLNEKDIYTLPHMEHPSLLKFIGSEERIGPDNRPEFMIVLSFSAMGCLQDYLRNNTIDWHQLCKMSLSVARGLAHLHTELGKGEKVKPCVAHRDLTSRNILMKSDGTCMLCDFGFAIRISGSKYFQNGEEQVAETTSLADVGTLRYMAPEILEGAVNLRDCESSLKQIDVYALGLVLWEIATRCTDLFQGVEVPEYKLPFESEIGVHPTMEQMQVLVTRHKARPLFPDIWKDSNPAERTLKETIEECWDQDAEARLTTLCAEERLVELPVLWERFKVGCIIPTSVSSSNINIISNEKALCKIQSSDDISGIRNNGEVHILRERAHSLSEGTIETLLSPSEPGNNDIHCSGNMKNSTANNIISSTKLSVPLQPHQGRNLCLERNLMLEPVRELTVSGNTLLELQPKTALDINFLSYSDGDTAMYDSSILESSSLVSNDTLSNSTQISNPNPHFLNTVHNTSIIPKKPNIPGNGHTLGLTTSRPRKDRHWRPTKFFDWKKRTQEDICAGLKSLLERKSSSTSTKILTEEQQPLKELTVNCYSPASPGSMDVKFGQTNNINCVWTPDDVKGNDPQLIDTEVRIIKPDLTSTIVRPVNNAHVCSNDEEKDKLESVNKTVSSEVDKSTQNNLLMKSILAVDNIQCDRIEKTKRPNSLPLQESHNEYSTVLNIENVNVEESAEKLVVTNDSTPICRKSGSGKRKGVKRVKTPFEIKGRFSLYDDRIMSSQELSAAYSKESVQPVLGDNTKFSTSVPLDMNSLCSSQSINTMNMHTTHSDIKCTEVKPKNGLKVPLPISQVKVIHSLCDI